MKIGEIGHNAGALAFTKCLNWFKNKSSVKRLKNDCKSTLELFCAINGLKKRLILKKNDSFLKISKIGHNAGAIAFTKCSNWFKIESSLQRLENDCKNHIRVGLSKKRLQKTPDIKKNYNFLKISKIGHSAGAIAFRKCSNWFKNESSIKRLKNDCKSTLQLFCAINGFKKCLIFQK